MYEYNLTKLGRRIKAVRACLGLKQNICAQEIGIGHRTLSDIERGVTNPHCWVIWALVFLYGVNIYFLFTGEGDMFLPPTEETDFAGMEDLAHQLDDIKDILSGKTEDAAAVRP